MKKFKVRFYRTNGSPLEVVIEAKSEYEARNIVKAQYAASFKEFASSREIR